MRNPVVAERVVALGDVGADPVGLVVEAVEREVDVAIVVGDADFGPEDVGHLVAADRVVETHWPVGIGAASTPGRRGCRRSSAERTRGTRYSAGVCAKALPDKQ